MEQIVEWLMRILPIFAAVMVLLLFLELARSGRQAAVFRACVEFGGLLRERSKGSRWYRRTDEWLIKNGAAFHYGEWVHPLSYLALRVVLSLVGFVGVSTLSVPMGVLIALVLWELPGLLLIYMNSQDNLRLLAEIKLVYHALELQIRAGVYVTDALAECYGSVQEARLKQALLSLAGDIVMKADVFHALEQFQAKFDNRYIDTLCITLLQALESGQAVELLSDIAEQIKDMEGTVMERKKASLDRSITFYQLGVLAAVMGVVLYACVTHMYAAAVTF